ncbi:polysaccharide lyase [Bosea psychrotolerans]|uniref:Polysaccharide lyase-like protein n=1 Tax=Bosea psychrotolerans TaxID=1871628 RepID=A0A2S4MAS6_9HYPH|nr:polysaccharide lyase [Bosea psychrotolerans]POR51751.1 polysaccharide lyase-like protein [Bosea psychrotolerans]
MRLGSIDRACRLLCLALALCGMGRAALANSSSDPAQLILRDDFEAGRFAPEGGLYYKENPEQHNGSVTFQSRNVMTGHGALTLSLKPSCPPQQRRCSERAEVWETPGVLASYNQTVWYGFAMFMDDPLPQDDGRHVMAQWKREIIPGAKGDYSPFLALRLYEGHLGVTVETDMIETFPIGGAARPKGCLPGEALALNRPHVQQTRALVAIESGLTAESYPAYFDACAPGIVVTRHADLPSARKGWIDFVFRSSPGPTGNGHVEIIADGVHVATVKGHIGHSGPGLDKNQYFKFGPYRAPNPQNWSLTFDDFRRGPRCTDVIRSGQCPAE